MKELYDNTFKTYALSPVDFLHLMSVATRREIKKGIPDLQNPAPALLSPLSLSALSHFDCAGEKIVEQGRRHQYLNLVQRGRFSVTRDGHVTGEIRMHQFAGAMSFLTWEGACVPRYPSSPTLAFLLPFRRVFHMSAPSLHHTHTHTHDYSYTLIHTPTHTHTRAHIHPHPHTHTKMCTRRRVRAAAAGAAGEGGRDPGLAAGLGRRRRRGRRRRPFQGAFYPPCASSPPLLPPPPFRPSLSLGIITLTSRSYRPLTPSATCI